MTTSLQIWRKRADAFGSVTAGTADWDAATPCTEWTARDVVEHVVATQRDFLNQHGLSAAADGDAGSTDPAALWRNHERLVSDLLADAQIAEREFAGYFGPSTVGATLAWFYGVDLIVHRWDLAASQGLDADLTDEELDAVDGAMDTFGEQAYAPGLFGPPAQVPDDAGRRTAVLARTGRRG